MPLRTDMPTRQDARPGTGDDRVPVPTYDPDRGGWYPATKPQESAAPTLDPRGH